MIKLILSTVIFFGCGYMGIAFSKKYKARVAELSELQRTLSELEHCMSYLGLPMAEALELASKNCDTELKAVFSYVAERLKGNPCCDMERVWRRSLSKYRTALYLEDKDVDIILDFAKNLGIGNREKEKNNIKAAAMRLKILEDEARCELSQNARMYRGLGFLFGIFVVIVLI